MPAVLLAEPAPVDSVFQEPYLQNLTCIIIAVLIGVLLIVTVFLGRVTKPKTK